MFPTDRHGLVHRLRALASGFTDTDLVRAQRCGELIRVISGVYAVAAERTPEQLHRLRAIAVLASIEPDHTLSHQSAATLHDLPMLTPNLRRDLRGANCCRHRMHQHNGFRRCARRVRCRAPSRGGPGARTDYDWSALLVGEFDGDVKYRKHLRPGETPFDAMKREKEREDALGRLGIMVVRWTWKDLEKGRVVGLIREWPARLQLIAA
ncbi:hypothetical protein [Gordonia sp. SL306]|uniref:hypothetical protein n=1 Tax=Gordonia sp. SL306 TaxID=2995145 RepID=UPI002D1E3594|nr:hypothetical protein [Gordonia sp. SL306]